MGSAEPACTDRDGDEVCRRYYDPDGLLGVRIPAIRPWGFHGLYLMSPHKPFDMETYVMNLMGRYFMTSGTEILDDVCLEDNSCVWLPQ